MTAVMLNKASGCGSGDRAGWSLGQDSEPRIASGVSVSARLKHCMNACVTGLMRLVVEVLVNLPLNIKVSVCTIIWEPNAQIKADLQGRRLDLESHYQIQV